jgi:acyl carrier protein
MCTLDIAPGFTGGGAAVRWKRKTKMNLVDQQVVEVLSEYLPGARGRIKSQSRLVEDLCIDSIGVVEVVMELNQRFSIDLPEEEVARWSRVADICQAVKHRVEASEKHPTGSAELSSKG